MNKSERLNDMMIFLNHKSFFNLSDIMERYRISKSTALRDIQALEALGMPLFAEHGRYGRYGILKNRLLSPIIFTVDEMYALYFSMLTLREYQSTPFHLDLDKLKQKFEACISEDHKSSLKKMETVFSLAALKQSLDSPLLKDILYAAISGSIQHITYLRSDAPHTYTVQFLRVSSSFGQWYVTGYSLDSRRLQVFRCDKIIALSPAGDRQSLNENQIHEVLTSSFREKDATDFEVAITSKGIDIFLKENYPSMSLVHEEGDEGAVIKGYYNKQEESFITSYFMSYGKELRSIKPIALKKLIIEKTEQKLAYLREM